MESEYRSFKREYENLNRKMNQTSEVYHSLEKENKYLQDQIQSKEKEMIDQTEDEENSCKLEKREIEKKLNAVTNELDLMKRNLTWTMNKNHKSNSIIQDIKREGASKLEFCHTKLRELRMNQKPDEGQNITDLITKYDICKKDNALMKETILNSQKQARRFQANENILGECKKNISILE